MIRHWQRGKSCHKHGTLLLKQHGLNSVNIHFNADNCRGQIKIIQLFNTSDIES
uniref:Uncharacterized protein n=1 Tax=Amphimedon queenslandica TaxID=400682 RepID=A0A1X7TLS7_AMPQE